jgi:hypothetical protein
VEEEMEDVDRESDGNLSYKDAFDEDSNYIEIINARNEIVRILKALDEEAEDEDVLVEKKARADPRFETSVVFD